MSSATPSIAERPALCPNCCTGNPAEGHFCTRCGAPLSSLATIDPLWSVWAEGFMVRKAVHRPRSWMTLAGIWLLFGPQVAVVVLPWVSWLIGDASAVRFWYGNLAMSAREKLLLLVMFDVPLILLFGAILYFTTRNFFCDRENDTASASQV